MSNTNKRILLHDRTGVPFTVQLGRELACRGHNVLYSYAAFFQSPKGSVERKESDVPNFRIEGMQMRKPFQKYSLIKRRFQELEYARDLVTQIKEYRPDVLILTGSPPDALAVVFKECRGLDIRLITWVQDIYSVAIQRILNKKLPALGNLVSKYYLWQEKRLLQASDEVILITEDFVELMDKWHILPERRHIIHNWTPLEEVPVRPKENQWARTHDLVDKFCFLYAGTLGLKHNPELLLKLAIRYRDNTQVQVVVISEGLGANWLREQKQIYSLPNLKLLGFQPFKQMPDVLGTADVLVGILEPDAGIYSAPSKVLTYLCAQRPLLLAMPPENLSARIVSENQAGLVVPPSEVEAFTEAAEKLVSDSQFRELCARNARQYAEKKFDIKAITDQFEGIIFNNHH